MMARSPGATAGSSYFVKCGVAERLFNSLSRLSRIAHHSAWQPLAHPSPLRAARGPQVNLGFGGG